MRICLYGHCEEGPNQHCAPRPAQLGALGARLQAKCGLTADAAEECADFLIAQAGRARKVTKGTLTTLNRWVDTASPSALRVLCQRFFEEKLGQGVIDL